jgi:hypothetical protein
MGKIPGYLDAALKALTLHTEARTSFITYAFSPLPPSPINLMPETHCFSLFFFPSRPASTFASLQITLQWNSFEFFPGVWATRRYWLPSLLKHEYIALRFITQSSYEKAAQMRVSPTPDVVTRVFMLFRGVHSDDVVLWAPAASRAAADDGATFWSNVVGVDALRASDPTLFRVLEWGGMEIE